MGNYVLSQKAEADLVEIYRYSYFNYGETQADFYVQSLKQKCETLADHPLMCRERHEFSPPVRIHHHQKHLIVYVMETDRIVIIRFLHGRMNIPQHLEDDDS